MKKSFIAGLVTLLPFVLTVTLVTIVFQLLTQPFAHVIASVLTYYNIAPNGFLFWSSAPFVHALSQFIILILLFLITLSIGYLGHKVIISPLVRMSDRILHKIPFFNKIYKTTKDVINTMLGPTSKAYKQVVLIPFPHAETHSLALVTDDNNDPIDPMITVYIPSTPNPTVGYITQISKSKAIYIDMSVEDAFKTVVSCGVFFTPVNRIERG